MSDIKFSIEGQDAVAATKELLAIEGIQGNYEIEQETQKDPLSFATIATIVQIVGGVVTIAEKIYEWYQKYQKAKAANNNPGVKKVIIVGKNGERFSLNDLTPEQIKKILEG